MAYTSQQIEAYLDRIALPEASRTSPVLCGTVSPNSPEGLSFLRTLQRHHLAAVPFENLSLHYSPSRQIALDASSVFDKIVGRRRGGYCMEVNLLFRTVLHTLGFDVYSVGGRVNEAIQPMATSKGWKGPKYDGWNHMVNIVTVKETSYLVDVANGSSGPHQPLPLEASNEPTHNIGDQWIRLVHGPIAQHTRPDQALWQYEIRNGEDTTAWTPAYCFTETEFLPEDFAMMNYFVSTHPSSWFTFCIVCVRMVLDEDGVLVGDLTLFNDRLKRRMGAQAEEIAVFTTEDERVGALESYFHISLSELERAAIHRTASAIQ
ncbi:hypothetical protein ASPZODRAFT_105044 [Penicilliopsis zonata CBS 506.65]|uniref:Uncharacterized protein n=1 Tax=Penicilliopsis zonata CBS 506.65 TaxID=1073090 RepID=A0A1L9S608_9EURO|nr:hypothetical protein ASPZODRAFT_105044 [Penicilliopsis zonata CBS 506.65]OJJ42608.1 hypothetical protein ASPZODRAFT_105044 [Penicilliopsis zonata CBS 506.65]